MRFLPLTLCLLLTWTCLGGGIHPARAQPATPEQAERIAEQLTQLQTWIESLPDSDWLPDVAVCAKAAEWILRHEEFYKPSYVDDTLAVLALGRERATELQAAPALQTPSWMTGKGTVALGYRSAVDGSVQPYALSFPTNFDPESPDPWPLTIKLHGRNGTLTEASFMQSFNNREMDLPVDSIQLDVFGRTNNAYRWSGETDVFEALADVQRRFRIDERRITLWGFSMGGAGAWHLGLHHPSRWSSVGAGAGFVDFYEYQKQTSKLPSPQHETLHIYDAVDYALNTANVPFITYGGEVDKQLAASLTMKLRALKLDVPLRVLVGAGMGHKFNEESTEAFTAFLTKNSAEGRPQPPGRTQIRFITYTPKYNKCEWLTIDEMGELYEPATVEGGLDDEQTLRLNTGNVTALSIARGISDESTLDKQGPFPLSRSAESTFVREGNAWRPLSEAEAQRFHENPDVHKRHDLQGPIDDAFMQPFLCVRGTGTPWSKSQHDWAAWTLSRFEKEFDKWLRGRVPVVNDTDLSDEQIANHNIILFGDPGSNAVLRRIIDRLPLEWTQEELIVNGQTYDPATHGVALIYPNPLNTKRYVVVNSGHTMHESDFRSSNAWLFPRLGDIAVQRYGRQADGSYQEETVWAALFDTVWNLPE
ncbi:MAG: prolyl oligopeptidase family serine peptidase [Planctomycetaceae bacterium]